MDLGPCREFGIDSGAAKEVEGNFGLWDELVPEMYWEVFVDTAEARNEVVLKCADGPFRGISTMHTGRY